MIADRRKFGIGLSLLAGFVVVLILLFLPIFDGKNALDALDALYNSISKGSAEYVPDLRKETARKHLGKQVTMSVRFEDEAQAATMQVLCVQAGAQGTQSAARLKVEGDLGRILQACLDDAEDMFRNEGEKLRTRYGAEDERAILYTWWLMLGEMDKDLKRQEKFAEAKFVGTVRTKGVECAYNYYGIVPEKILNKLGIVLASLAFYVIYTIWYGFAILYLFEGWGLRLGH